MKIGRPRRPPAVEHSCIRVGTDAQCGAAGKRSGCRRDVETFLRQVLLRDRRGILSGKELRTGLLLPPSVASGEVPSEGWRGRNAAVRTNHSELSKEELRLSYAEGPFSFQVTSQYTVTRIVGPVSLPPAVQASEKRAFNCWAVCVDSDGLGKSARRETASPNTLPQC